MDPCSYRSENELDYVRRRNANRPSVIYFHGLLNGEKSSENSGACNHITEKKAAGIKRCLNVQDEECKSSEEDEQKPNEDTTICSQDPQCLDTEGEEDCLRKRHRTSFTSFQLKRLEEEFDQDCYIVGMKRWRLSAELDIPEKQIKIWFQNRRTKVKKHCSNCAHKSRDERSRIV